MKEGKGKVLVVEDDASMGALLMKDLARRKFDVRHVTSAAEGLAIIAQDDVDVVVSDVRLGGMHGLELCERITTKRPDIPVILITAFGDLETAIAAIRAGARDFLPKPFEVEELALRLTNAIEAQDDFTTAADLPDRIRAFAPGLVVGTDASELVALDEVEKRYILQVLEAVHGNRTRASEILKIDRKTLYTRLKEIGWKPED
ncbi:MAG: response regulator [Clostridia bacterium]|nr:response regulator [Deltaproteobacteria bacterium]